jgi:Fe-S cluster assembly iron-binding protein IscA
MLALTKGAADAVETIVSQPDAPETAVLRITTETEEVGEDSSERELQMKLAEEPEEDDVLVQGMRISVEPSTLDFLDDKVLDAEVVGGGVRFSLYLQPQESSANGGESPVDTD